MKRWIQAAGVLLAVLALLAVCVPLLVNANQFRPRLEAALTSALGRQVTLGELSFSVLSGNVTTEDLSISDDPRFGAAPFIRAKSLKMGVDIWPLITTRELTVRDLTIDDAEITLLQNSGGDWNFATVASKRSPDGIGLLFVKLVTITNGRLSLGRVGGAQKPMVFDNVNLAVKEFAPGGRFPFSLTGKAAPAGEISVDGTAGPINPTDVTLTPVQVNLKISGVDLAASGITANPGVAGLLTVDGSGGVNGTTLDWKGTVRIDQARFVPQGSPAKQPVEFNFSIAHDLQKHSGVLSQGEIRLGNVRASLAGSYTEHGDALAVNLRLAGSAMPVSALIGMLPVFDVRLPAGSSLEGGTATVNMTVKGAVTDPVLAGTFSLNNTKLTGFDLGSKLGVAERLAGIHSSPDMAIQTLSASLRSDPTGTTIQDLKFIAPAIGEVNGAGTISPKHELDFKMRANVHAPVVFKAALGTSIPFAVKGTSTNPVVTPDVTGIAASEVKRIGNTKIGGVDANQVLNGLFGGRKKQ